MDKRMKDGVQTCCKECDSKRAKEYYNINKEERCKYGREYYREHKDTIKDKQRKYRELNKDKKQEYNHEYYEKNKNIIFKKQREYRECNKEKIYLHGHEYRQAPKGKMASKRHHHKRLTQKKNTEATLTEEQWYRILEMQHYRCNNQNCGKRFTKKRPPTIDHIIPLSKGGGLTFENVQALCGRCNSSKKDKMDPRFIQTWVN